MNQASTDILGLIKLLVSPKGLDGEVNPTQLNFITSMDVVKWYVGPAGCAKTSSLMASVILPALLMPGSRWLIARYQSTTLRETTMLEFDEMLKRISPDGSIIVHEVQTPYRKLKIRPAVAAPDGKEYYSEFIFRGLDEESKFGSMQLTGIAIDEADEIPRTMAEALVMRLRYRLPWQKEGPPEGPFFLNMVSNPPPKSHWLHLAFCQEDGCDAVPMGRKFSPDRLENSKNLPKDYYDKPFFQNMTHEMKERLIHGRCGPTASGKAVFGQDFSHDLHVKTGLKPVPGMPIIRGWDFGRRRPALVWSQVTPEGWHNRFKAILGEGESTRAFTKRVIQISKLLFPGYDFVDYCDPHGTARQSTSDKSDIDILREEGIDPKWRDVSWERGLDAMGEELATLKKGRPVACFDREGCSLLIEGYSSGYKYPIEKPNKELKPKPVKDGFYEHLMDADRYTVVCLKHGPMVPVSQHAATLRKAYNPITGR